ncbi:MAG: FeoB-associated Cys-rich membrane protein [Clostridia bacterium]|nr:FeoB-associated Cys-rich membrane protein [Clostridia bacterium]
MNAASIAVLLVLLALVILAVRRIRRKRLLFSCGGDCSRCAGHCPKKTS